MPKLKLQYFSHLVQRADSLEKVMMLGKIEGRRRRERQRTRWLDGSPTQWTWVWASSGRWWKTGKPGMLQSMGHTTEKLHNNNSKTPHLCKLFAFKFKFKSIFLSKFLRWIWYVMLCKLEKAMAPYSSTLAWKIPCTEEPGGLQSMGSWRVGHDWATSLHFASGGLLLLLLLSRFSHVRIKCFYCEDLGSNTWSGNHATCYTHHMAKVQKKIFLIQN